MIEGKKVHLKKTTDKKGKQEEGLRSQRQVWLMMAGSTTSSWTTKKKVATRPLEILVSVGGWNLN